MNYSNLFDIVISNCPETGKQRRADAIRWGQQDEAKFLFQEFRVHLLNDAGERLVDTDARKYSYVVKFFASNNWIVNPATGTTIGEVAQLTPAQIASGIGQWDFFVTLSNDPVDVNEYRYMLAMEADANGKFNV